MLGLSFQPARRERHRAVACRRRRTESGIAAGLPLHARAAGLGAHLDCRQFHPVPGGPEQARAGNGDDRDGAGCDRPGEPLRLSRDAEGHDRRDEAERACGPEDHRSNSGRARRSRGRDRRLALCLARLCRHPLRRSQRDHAGERQELSGRSASIAPSRRPRCRPARSSMAG